MVDYWGGCHDRKGLSWSCQSLMKPAISPMMRLGVGGCSGGTPLVRSGSVKRHLLPVNPGTRKVESGLKIDTNYRGAPLPWS